MARYVAVVLAAVAAAIVAVVAIIAVGCSIVLVAILLRHNITGPKTLLQDQLRHLKTTPALLLIIRASSLR